MQSDTIDDILLSTCDPIVKNLRMSLQTIKKTILVNESGQKDSKSLWNHYTKDLGFSFNEKDSSIRDSMFASKV